MRATCPYCGARFSFVSGSDSIGYTCNTIQERNTLSQSPACAEAMLTRIVEIFKQHNQLIAELKNCLAGLVSIVNDLNNEVERIKNEN